MSRSLLFFFFLALLSLIPIPILSQNSSSCPLDFTVLNKFITAAAVSSIPPDTTTRCSYAVQALHLVFAEYLRTASLFLPPPSAAAACWSAYQALVSPISSQLTLPAGCGFQVPWISQGCTNITSRADFESIVPASAISEINTACNQSLATSPPCTACSTALNRVSASYLTGPSTGNVTNCASYPFIYAGAFNRFGPADNDTALCLFLLSSSPVPSSSSHHSPAAWVYAVATVGGILFLILAGLAAWFLLTYQRRRRERMMRRKRSVKLGDSSSAALESISASTTLIKFSFEDIRAATKNFSRENIIGRGGYGNVYKGVLEDGSDVALKRFKNCSAAGDASFAHEVEVIASVRHVNLVALRGYCTATTVREGHQRIIVCDLMCNGSLHDHLFSSEGKKLSWPIRQRIALGTAKGIAYLHYDAQPKIIHRDIKGSNILLDETFEPKVADFGLARYAPEGMTHVSTRAAGTLGFLAPEYALYGQLTEKSDVYSFGVVLLELLSGKKAFMSTGEGQTSLVTDWAWSLVRKGRALDVIEEGMEELGPQDVLEKYVLLAVLCSHPELHARPTMDQIVKILETDVAVPTIPDRPLSILANMDDIERSISSSGSGQLSSLTGYQTFSMGHKDADSDNSDHSDMV